MLRNYIKIAWRNINRHKFYAWLNLLGLTLGISGTLLIGLLVYYHLSFDNFHQDTERIYRVVNMTNFDVEDYDPGVPQPFGNTFKRDYAFAEEVAMRVNNYANLITVEKQGVEERFDGEPSAFVQPAYFKIFNYPLLYGNQQEILTQPHTAIITERLAKRYFGASNAIGKNIKLNNKLTYTITGILEDIPDNTDNRQEIYLSYHDYQEQNPWMASDSSWSAIATAVQCFVKLKPHISPKQVEAVFPAMLNKHITKNADKYHLFLQPLRDIHLNTAYEGKVDQKQLYGLALIGLFLVAMACMNFVSLATAQAFSRAKEVGVRKTLGSTPKQILMQFLLETGFIVSLAFLLASVVVWSILPYFNSFFDTQIHLNDVNPVQLLLAAFVSVISITIASGYYPGLKLAAFRTTETIKGMIIPKEPHRFSLRKILVLVQFCIVQVLIICTMIVAKQMFFAMKTNAAFKKEGLVFLGIPERKPTAINTLRNQLEAIPEIKELSFSFSPPLTDEVNNYNSFTFDNRPEETSFQTNIKRADEHYLSVYSLSLLHGKNFTAEEDSSVLVNETFVKSLNIRNPKDVIGKTISYENKQLPIIGVLKDFHNVSIHQKIDPVCIIHDSYQYNNVALKIAANNLRSALPKIEKIWKDAFPKDLYTYHFYDEELERMYKSERNLMLLINTFAALAIIIGCLGLFGLISFMVQQKTKEIGVRKVLGASLTHVLWLFGKQFAQLLLLAAIIASPIAILVMTFWLNDFAYRITIGADTIILSVLITVAIAGITISYKTIKAATANPVDSLRNE